MALALGNAAFVDEDYTQALDLYTQALQQEPSNTSALVSRAQANIKLGHFADAIADANAAIEINPSFAKAYIRKGTACFSSEDYETAKAAFEKAASLEDDQSTRDWIRSCEEKLQGKSKSAVPREAEMRDSVSDTDVVMAPPLPPPKYRHEWYQSPDYVVVTVFAKGIDAQNASIEFGEQMLSVVIKAMNEEPYVLQVRLCGKVNPSKCVYNLLSTKIEIRLAKADDTHWRGLTYEQSEGPVLKTPPKCYPSSSKKAAEKDWDKLEAEVKKEEKDEKLEGDAALNKLFREVYSNADEDTRRAMNKSFVESNGTVLSTNWKEVGSKKIEGSAPQGMEMKKWEA